MSKCLQVTKGEYQAVEWSGVGGGLVTWRYLSECVPPRNHQCPLVTVGLELRTSITSIILRIT
jgi:hypothetical protein